MNPRLDPAPDSRLAVRSSTVPGAGDGLFALVPLAAGERIEVVGVFVPVDSLADRCTGFADHHKFRVGEELLIPVGPAGMANHSDRANLAKLIADGRVWLETTRDVVAGEELVVR